MKLIDFRSQLPALASSTNPVSKVVEAHLAALDAKGNVKLEYENKLFLVKNLYSLGYTGEEIRILYAFIDYVLTLPDDLEEDFMQNMREFEEKNEMHYVTSAERLGIKKGKLEGKLEGQLELLDALILITNKFEHIPAAYLTKIRGVAPTEVQELCKKILTASTIDELFN